MDFQKYYDGVGLIVQNKINGAFVSCPLCNEKVQWDIVFDFNGDIICVLAKCPTCGGIIKTIFNFANNQPITTFMVSEVGEQNRNNLNLGVNYTLPNANYNAPYGVTNQSAPQTAQKEDSGSAGWGVLGFFIPIVGFILWLVWKDSKPKSSMAAGIGCLVSICLSVVSTIIVYAVLGGLIGGFMSSWTPETEQCLQNILWML